MQASTTPLDTQSVAPVYTLWQLVLYMLKLGTIGFGGPVALVGYMHRDLVEKRSWISEADYKEGMALSQLAPGPLAAQLAIYLGYVHYRILGATLVGIAFVDGVTAAAIGAITGSVVVIAQRSIVDIPTIVLALIAAGLLWKFKKLQEPVIIATAALIGLVAYPLVHS